MQHSSFKIVSVILALVLSVSFVGCADSNGDDRTPGRLLSTIKDNYKKRDVSEEVTYLLNFHDFGREDRGCLDSLGVTVQQVVAWGDYYLIDSLHRLYEMSKDSCSVRAVNKEVDGIRGLMKQLKSVDYLDLGVTEEMLEACRIEGEVFNVRDRLKIIQERAADENFSEEIKQIRELEAQASWSFADLPISAESLRVIEVTTIFSKTRKTIYYTRDASERADLEGLEYDLEEVARHYANFQGNYAGTHPLWDIYLSETRQFISKESRELLYKRAHEVRAIQMVHLMRTRNPVQWVRFCQSYDRETGGIVFNPPVTFLEHQGKSGYAIDHFLPTEEFNMWKKKWS